MTLSPDLTVEPAEKQFARHGARLCVVIPHPELVEIMDVLRAGNGKAFIHTGGEEDDTYIVRIGNGPQESLYEDTLRGRIGERSLDVE